MRRGSLRSVNQSSAAAAAPPVTLLTCDDALAERVVTLAAAAGAALDRPVLPTRGPTPAPGWARVPLLLVGADVADPDHPGHPGVLRGAGPPGGVVVLAVGPPPSDLWRHALAVGADQVAVLPEGDAWLLDRLSDAVSGPPGGRVVAVVGGRGGAGASTLAVTLALAAGRRRLHPLLVDADPLGGGIDLILGAEEVPGLRWPDVADVHGRLQPGLLVSSCPLVDGVRLLSWGAGPLTARSPGAVDAGPLAAGPDAVRAVLEASVREAGVTVVDLPRAVDEAQAVVLERCRAVLLVVPAEVRAAAAAARLAAVVRSQVDDVRLVVRGPAPGGLPARAVADLLGLDLEAALPPEPGLAALLDRGEAAAVRPRGALARFADRFVAGLVTDGAERSGAAVPRPAQSRPARSRADRTGPAGAGWTT